jgi:hypothetical protein
MVVDFLQIHFHAFQEGHNQLVIDVVLINNLLEGVQNWIQANSPFNGDEGIILEFFQQGLFVEIMEGIHNLIGKTYKSVNGLNGWAQFGGKQTNS